MVLVKFRVTVLAVDPVKFLAVMVVAAVWVTAPVIFAPVPKVRVAFTPPLALMIPKVTAAPLRIRTAVMVLAVVVRLPVVKFIGPPPPFTEISPVPALTAKAPWE